MLPCRSVLGKIGAETWLTMLKMNKAGIAERTRVSVQIDGEQD